MDCEQIVNIFKNEPERFNRLVKDLDETTKFIILQPFKKVFTKFASDKVLIQKFLEKVKEDLENRKNTKRKFDNIDRYVEEIHKNIHLFVDYYTAG